MQAKSKHYIDFCKSDHLETFSAHTLSAHIKESVQTRERIV